MMKRSGLLACVLAVLIALSCFPASGAFAAVTPYVASDTAKSVSLAQNETYQFKFTVYGTHAKPKISSANRNILTSLTLTSSRDSKGNDVYYFKVKAVGEPGTSTGVYTTLPGRTSVRQCIVNIVRKTVPYRFLYAGFVPENDKTLKLGQLPTGNLLLGTEKDWDAFKSKYLRYSPDVDYSSQTSFDFNRDSILYHSQPSAKQNVYGTAAAIDKVALENHKPVLYEKSFENGFRITASGDRRYVVLVLVKKSDIK